MATDCQLEFGHRTGLVFKPFVSNFATLLVRPRKSHPEPNRGHLIIKKAFGHIEERQQVSLTTMNLDLRDPLDISSLPDLKVDLDEAIENEIDDNEAVIEKNITAFFTSLKVDGLSEGNVKRIMKAGFKTIPTIILRCSLRCVRCVTNKQWP